MTVPTELRASADRALRRFCEGRVPAALRDEVTVEYDWRADSATIYERRAPWQARDTAWSTRPVAQLRYDEDSREWSLYWRRANGRWLWYEPAGRHQELGGLIRWLGRDPDGVFWG